LRDTLRGGTVEEFFFEVMAWLVLLPLIVFFSTQAQPDSKQPSSDGSIYLNEDNQFVVQPPPGGTVALVNFTEMSLLKSELSVSKSAIASTERDLVSALEALDGLNQRVAALRTFTNTTTTTTTVSAL
jgi:hypothetical protein